MELWIPLAITFAAYFVGLIGGIGIGLDMSRNAIARAKGTQNERAST